MVNLKRKQKVCVWKGGAEDTGTEGVGAGVSEPKPIEPKLVGVRAVKWGGGTTLLDFIPLYSLPARTGRDTHNIFL